MAKPRETNLSFCKRRAWARPVAFALLLAAAAGAPARAEDDLKHEERPRQFHWSFAGVMGKYDQEQLRRGFKIYREVCSNCHSMKLVAFRNLGEPGGPNLPAAEVQSIAASYKVKDGPDAKGEYFERPGRPSDRLPSPFPNEQAARAALGGAYPPDMSTLAKARGHARGFPTFLIDLLPGFAYQEGGPDYIASLLEGYRDAPKGLPIPDGQYYDVYMPGRRLAMTPPLSDDIVTYDDKAPQTVDQYAQDVSAFLMWAAEPHLDQRKSVGRAVLAFLIVFAGLLYYVKRYVWAGVKH